MSTKPDLTLQPSKGIITEATARIYAAYIINNCVKEGESDHWIRRSIKEAILIASKIDKSILSDDELPDEQPLVHEPVHDLNKDTSDTPASIEKSKGNSSSKSKKPASKKTQKKRTTDTSRQDAGDSAARAAAEVLQLKR